ncbi:exo-alpha-sialidase [Paenibacillus sp. F411]|uniref:sialidase family protein n=1 Tax=Paenibacillus sp. F411 TaxID=2820239 RepID=UPI001AAFEED9|nr:sialidase family protein [Paenibacillus sp. F411]MBO2945356.1 exo-alpha-sialidase [Paenibacillus sp. F411]
MTIFNFQVTPGGPPRFEPTIAVNLLSVNNMVATSVYFEGNIPLVGAYTSFDGGGTWNVQVLPLPDGFTGSEAPFVAYAFPSTFVIAVHAFPGAFSGTTVVYRSTDNGVTFSPPVTVAPGYGLYINNDEPAIEVDNATASPFIGNFYAAYNRQFNIEANARSVAFFQRSLDQGVTWEQPVLLSSPSDVVERPDITVSQTGSVFATWITTNPPSPTFFLRRSLDGGQTFEPSVVISPVDLVPIVLPVPGYGFRVLTFPNIAADITTLSTSGNLYAVWQDFRLGYSDIFFSKSTDQGQSWSPPVSITGAPANSQSFFPALDVDPLVGVVNVIYYSNRIDGFDLDVFTARSIDGGNTFTNQRVTAQSFNPNEGSPTPVPLIGDYIDIKSVPPYGYIGTWTDTVTGTQTIFAGFNTDPVA